MTLYSVKVNLPSLRTSKPISGWRFPCTSLLLAAFLNSDYGASVARTKQCQNYLVIAWVRFIDVFFPSEYSFFLSCFKSGGHYGGGGHFLNTRQYGGGEDLL